MRSSSQLRQEYSEKTPEILDIKLTGLPTSFTARDIRSLCEGLHVVNSTIDSDTLTGACKGVASLSLRFTDQKVYKLFQLKALSQGIEIAKKENKPVLKSNYWQISNVPLQEFRNSRTPNPDVDARAAKVNEQISSVFGKPRRFTPVRQGRDKSFQAQMQWKRTKNPKKEIM